jgi:1-acyl-sn-glycerol-3-phosphate acyltransferase
LKGVTAGRGVELSSKLDYRETVGIAQGFFAWQPDPLGAVLVRILSGIMRPLEQGTYTGRPLSGEPHRSSWVIASPLAVFVMPEAGYRHRLFLAARLRSTGPINIIEDPPEGRRFKRRRGADGRGTAGKRKRGRAMKRGKRRIVKAFRDEGVEFHHELEALIAIQRESEVALTVIPVVRAYHQLTPDAPATTVATRVYKLHPLQVLRKVTNWARTVRTARVKNCSPLVLSRWLDERPGDDLCSQAAELRLELKGNIESERRACTGPPLAPNWEVKRRVLADPLLTAYMHDYALMEGTTREAVLSEARECLDEIASDYRVGVARYFCRAVDYAFDKFLDGLEVDREGIRFLSECDSRSRIVLVCSHKSYMDPLLIGYTLFRSGMVPPQQAAGLNLNFWPVGWLLRHSGAFYLRRTFSGETLYREVFCAYVRYLLAENYTSVVYIEGTRSRDGKLQRPKTGYLNILAESLNAGVCPDITLVPVYLGYDKVPEESSHVREMAGGRKVSESMKMFTRIYKSINTRLGRAYVKFGTPMSMKALLEEHGLQGCAEVVSEGINRVTPVTARSIAACALLAPGTTWISAGAFEQAAGELLEFCSCRGLPLSADADRDGVRAALDWFVTEGHVTPERSGDEEGFEVAGSARRFLEYNKNIPLGHFLGPAISSVAWKSCRRAGDVESEIEEASDFLGRLFSQEFVFDPSGGDEEREVDHEAYSGVLCSLLDSYLEAYLAACAALGRLDFGEAMGFDELVEACFDTAEGMLADGVTMREESPCRVAFKNALRCFRDMDLVEERRTRAPEGKESIEVLRGPRYEERGVLEERIRSFLEH